MKFELFLEYQNPCLTGDPALNPNGGILFCSAQAQDACPSNYWCHVGADSESSVCCPQGREFILWN